MAKKTKNPYLKRRSKDDPYEIWKSPSGDWEYRVLKKNQVDDNKPFASSFCFVISPYMPQGELGNTYVRDYKNGTVRVK